MHLGLIGNPENRRVAMFCEAARSLGVTVECLSWLEVLHHFRHRTDGGDTLLKRKISVFDQVRLEALGENEKVEQLVLEAGGTYSETLRHAQIGMMDQYYKGLCRILRWLASSGGDFQNHPNAICETFDKWESALRFESANLSRPKTLLAPQTWCGFNEFRQHFGQRHGRLFLKPRFSSSASGICAYRWQGQQQQLIAPIEIERSGGKLRLFNTLKVRSYTHLRDIQAILSRLLPQQMIAEQWIPKLSLNSRRCDLRIVVIDGTARHLVVRKSSSPMTNLHLGNERGALEELEEKIGVNRVDTCRDLATAAFGCFDGLTYAGVDIMLDSRRQPYVCEINSFGDLLPGISHLGQSTYEATLECVKKRFISSRDQVQLEV